MKNFEIGEENFERKPTLEIVSAFRKIQSKRDRNVRYDHVQVSSGLRLDFGREPVADQGGGGQFGQVPGAPRF